MDARFKNIEWALADDSGKCADWQRASIAVLMDIRDELQTLNRILGCSRFLNIPNQLVPMAEAARRQNRNAAARRKAKKAKVAV